MSKSRGNGVDPLAWIQEYGADAVRFTLARGANPGADQAIAKQWVEGARNFCSKLFNATRFAMLNGARVSAEPVPDDELTMADRWILDRLDATIEQTSGLLADFQLGKAAEALYHFAWDEVCDWYLELVKVQILQGADDPGRLAATRAVLGTVLDALLALLHPFVPFVTETLWTALTGGQSLVISPWPQPSGRPADPAAAGWISDLQTLVTEIRRFRSDQGLDPKRRVPARLTGGPAGLDAAAAALTRLTAPADDFTASAAIEAAVSGGSVRVEVDTSTALDVPAEIARLEKDLAIAHREVQATQAKLTNEAFLAKAQPQAVQKTMDRAARATADVQRLTARLQALSAHSLATADGQGRS